VLARCSAVVHAGGHGTTAAVLSAGRPAVVLPQLFDQQWHGERVEALGAGLLVARWPKRAAAVEAALRRVLNEPSFTVAAAELAAGLATEDGPGTAADAIEARLAAAAAAA
jgi:sterol 3beta-glucosyltransferase